MNTNNIQKVNYQKILDKITDKLRRSVLREKIAQLFSFMHAARLAAAMFLNI